MNIDLCLYPKNRPITLPLSVVSPAPLSKLFVPTIWLSGRMGFSRKFMLIGVVMLLVLGLLSEPLLRNSQQAVRTAGVERHGLQQIAAQADLLQQLLALRGQPQTNLPPNKPTVAEALAIHIRQAREAGLDTIAERLERGWQLTGLLGDDEDKPRRFAAYTSLVNGLLSLMRETARIHRLNVDPRLDVTFELLSSRLPQVAETLAKQRDALQLQSGEMSSYALSAQVALTEAVAGLKSGVAQLAEEAPNSALHQRAERFLAELLDKIALQQDATDKAMADPIVLPELFDLATGNLELANSLFDAVAAAADAQLVTRIERLQRDQLFVASLLIGAVLAISYLFAGIYLSTLRSLKSLAEGTEAFCAGKLDTRIRIDTRDELVLVARNFNTVATEFSRLLDVIREQNESRQRELERLVAERTHELAEKNEQLAQYNARVAEELKLARNMQLAILPQSFPNEAGWSVAASMYPAREMGGDFYDCFDLPDGRHGLLVADVSGKGVAAAFFMAVSRTVLLDLALAGGTPAQVMARANDLLCNRNPMELFVTVFYAIYDPRSGRLDYASAGHNPPLRRLVDGKVVELPCPHDTALGIMAELDYSDGHVTLKPGELLLMFTDGVPEAFDAQGEAYGDERTRRWLAGVAPETDSQALVASLVEDVAIFVDGAEASDDLTCLILCRRKEDPLMDYLMPSKLEEIERLAHAVETALDDLPDVAFSINLCLEELITNTILYGLSGSPDRQIRVRMLRSTDWLEVIIEDDAPPFNPFAEAPEPNIDADIDERPIGGLGVHLVRTMMDETTFHHDGQGNRISLRKQLAIPPV